jgi:hypothetical protein
MDYQTKGERFTMKKNLSIALSILLICGVLALNAGIVQAGNAAYSITEAYQGVAVVADGTWGADEWSDGWIEYMSGTTTKFAYKMSAGDTYMMSWALETTDNTDDEGDVFQICIDGNNDGGAAPQADDNKIEVTGHTTLTVYKGTGTDWAEMTGATTVWAESMATGHWVVEIQADKASLGDWGANPPPQGLRVAMYDASTETWVQWPPTSTANNPDSWGVIADYTGTVPEGLSFGIVALLSTVVVAGAFVLSKRTKSANLALIAHK